MCVCVCVWKRCRIPSPFTFYEKKRVKPVYLRGVGGERGHRKGHHTQPAKYKELAKKMLKKAKGLRGGLQWLSPSSLKKKKKMKKKKKGVYTEEAITEPRGRFGAYPGSDRVTKAPSKNGETPGIGEGRVAIFPLTHTHTQTIYRVCVCVCVC